MEIDDDAKWATIKTCIINASEQEVKQAEMAAFLKRVFNTAIRALQDLVEAGIDLGDKVIVSRLQELILAICQIPQHRIHAFDVSTVLKEFEEYEEHFYGYLSLPKQDAETSFTCDWLIDRLADFAKNPPEGEEYGEKLTLYMDLCGNLMRSGSNRIRAYLADALEKLAQSCKYVTPDGLYRFLAYYIGEQNAENSVCCDFVVRKINYLADHPNEVNSEVLDSYLDICEKLAENGSDKIRAYLVRATENLAQILTSEWMRDEAKMVWDFVIKLLSQENVRIIQREKRLLNAQTTINYF